MDYSGRAILMGGPYHLICEVLAPGPPPDHLDFPDPVWTDTLAPPRAAKDAVQFHRYKRMEGTLNLVGDMRYEYVGLNKAVDAAEEE